MAFYTVKLMDTDGTELAVSYDLCGLKDARAEMRCYASDSEYRNSGAKRVELYNTKGQLLETLEYKLQPVPVQSVDALKAAGSYFAAGALAYALGQPMNYGCHFGMRSELERARQLFAEGWQQAARNR